MIYRIIPSNKAIRNRGSHRLSIEKYQRWAHAACNIGDELDDSAVAVFSNRSIPNTRHLVSGHVDWALG